MHKHLTLALILIFFAISSEASLQASAENDTLRKAFFKRQVKQNVSVGRAMRSIASHYPQEAASFVEIALELYPEKHREIIFGAISAQPAATQNIVQAALDSGVTSCVDIVELAILAEPSYVDFVVDVAARATPEELNEIVRVAVMSQPDSADRIVQTLAKSHPNKLVNILSTAMNAVPLVGEYMVDALLAVFPNKAEEVVTTAVRESLIQNSEIESIINTAQNAGLTNGELRSYAMKGGATESQISKALTTSIID